MKNTILPKKNIIKETETAHPFGHANARAARDKFKGHAKAFVTGGKPSSMKDAKQVNFGQLPKKSKKVFA
jgi:hypothetical protein